MGCSVIDVYGIQSRVGGVSRGSLVFEADETRGWGGEKERVRECLFGGGVGALRGEEGGHGEYKLVRLTSCLLAELR